MSVNKVAFWCSKQAMKAGLLTTTFLEAMVISQDKRSYRDTADDDTSRQQIDVRTPS